MVLRSGKRWKLNCGAGEDSTFFIDSKTFLSGPSHADNLETYAPLDKFDRTLENIRLRNRARTKGFGLLSLSGGVAVLMAAMAYNRELPVLWNYIIIPLALSAMSVPFFKTANSKNDQIEWEDIDWLASAESESFQRIQRRANWLREHRIDLYVRNSGRKICKLTNFDWDMDNAIMFLLGLDKHRAGLGLDRLSNQCNLYFRKSDVEAFVKMELEALKTAEEDELLKREALVREAAKQKKKREAAEKQAIADQNVRRKREEKLAAFQEKAAIAQIEASETALKVAKEKAAIEKELSALELEARKEALEASREARKRDAEIAKKKAIKRPRKRHSPYMLVVCYQKDQLDRFVELGIKEHDLVPRQKAFLSFLLFIHDNWDAWKAYRDNKNKKSDEVKKFEAKLGLPLELSHGKNETRLKDVRGLRWRYLDDWLEKLDFIPDHPLPLKGELPTPKD